MEFNELLKALEAKLGGGVALAPDESGTVMLEIDEMSVSIMGMDEMGVVALIGDVGEPPPEEGLQKLYRAMLEANHNFAGTAGATLSINPDTGSVGLCKILESVALDGERFFNEIERFVNTLETWRKLVADFRGTVERGESVADEPFSFGGQGDASGLGGLLRV